MAFLLLHNYTDFIQITLLNYKLQPLLPYFLILPYILNPLKKTPFFF